MTDVAAPPAFMDDGDVLPKRRRAFSEKEDISIKRMISSGLTSTEIAACLNRDRGTIAARMRYLGVQGQHASIALRFQSKFVPEPNSGCWLWLGCLNSKGRAIFRLSGRSGLASHFSLLESGRPVPAGMCACHSCDNPACVNPDHLFIGTHLDNMRDCLRKGRFKFPPPRIFKARESCARGHILPLGRGTCMICKEACDKARRQKFMATGLTGEGKVRQRRASIR